MPRPPIFSLPSQIHVFACCWHCSFACGWHLLFALRVLGSHPGLVFFLTGSLSSVPGCSSSDHHQKLSPFTAIRNLCRPRFVTTLDMHFLLLKSSQQFMTHNTVSFNSPQVKHHDQSFLTCRIHCSVNHFRSNARPWRSSPTTQNSLLRNVCFFLKLAQRLLSLRRTDQTISCGLSCSRLGPCTLFAHTRSSSVCFLSEASHCQSPTAASIRRQHLDPLVTLPQPNDTFALLLVILLSLLWLKATMGSVLSLSLLTLLNGLVFACVFQLHFVASLQRGIRGPPRLAPPTPLCDRRFAVWFFRFTVEVFYNNAFCCLSPVSLSHATSLHVFLLTVSLLSCTRASPRL